uniref:Dimer_Tnp_hAT domain-containing protein n=1 Tax=Macrostomum lignano TaxID=282301 RepID=A0A1I8FX33_9PLAT
MPILGLTSRPFFSTTLGEWGIGLEQVSLLLRDGASNMKLAGELLKVPSAHCAAHKLNLVVKDSISGHRGLKTILDKARSIVGHFHHSVTAQANLKTLQLQLKLPTHSLVQDVDTRWNSTLAMLRRINEQEEAFSVYRTRHRPIEILTDNESDVSKKAVKLLEIFEVFTLEVSRETASISCILPMVKVSLEHLQQVDCFGITYLRDDLVKGLTQRFSDEKKSHHHIVATMLDPRFRLDFFDEEQRNFAKAELVKAMNEILRETSLPTVDGDTAIDEDLSDVSIETEPQTESQPQQLSMSALFEKSSTSSAAAATLRDLSRAGTLLPVSNRGNAMDKLAREMAAYLSEPRLPFEEDPMKFWRDKTPSTAMSALVRKFLGPPPTSVPSERIFSNVGNIYEPKRRRLLGETVEKLVFINYNVRKFDP